MPSNPYAFPVPFARDQNGQFEASNHFDMAGMELRDYFAGQALIGLLFVHASSSAAKALVDHITRADASVAGLVVDAAYEYADAMLEARGQKTEGE